MNKMITALFLLKMKKNHLMRDFFKNKWKLPLKLSLKIFDMKDP